MSKEIMVAAVLAATPLDCLSLNIYHEARGESKLGQIAVGHVTLNRVKSKLYPSSICKVVYQYRQFSWTQDKISDKPRNKKLYKSIRILSAKIMGGEYKDPTFGAMYFHTKQIRPRWMNKVKGTVTIGNHIFYRR
jgi:spore germination cell wall hydrolase CwlJ-like protein